MKHINDNYRLLEKIGKGSFGEVYKVVDKNNKELACKVEDKQAKTRLKNEYNIYKIFKHKNIECVPKIYDYTETPKYNLLTMQLLGKSLDTIFEEKNKSLDVGTVMKIGIKIIEALEKIHKIGIIHRDIKPNNFMFGMNEYKNDLYIMDFGLSKKWRSNGKHLEYKSGRSLIGTARYASVNIHMGIEPSRRDDLESVSYMLVYLLKGKLPWQGLKKKTKDNPNDHIGQVKTVTNLEKLCEGLPSCFLDMIIYTRNLEFPEKPDYKHLVELFYNSAREHKITIKYYWE